MLASFACVPTLCLLPSETEVNTAGTCSSRLISVGEQASRTTCTWHDFLLRRSSPVTMVFLWPMCVSTARATGGWRAMPIQSHAPVGALLDAQPGVPPRFALSTHWHPASATLPCAPCLMCAVRLLAAIAATGSSLAESEPWTETCSSECTACSPTAACLLGLWLPSHARQARARRLRCPLPMQTAFASTA